MCCQAESELYELRKGTGTHNLSQQAPLNQVLLDLHCYNSASHCLHTGLLQHIVASFIVCESGVKLWRGFRV
jgi:hypothetical protein